MPIDLDAYLHRIGHAGPRVPSLATLQAVHRQHAEAIAFENLNPFLGWPVLLDSASLERKLVHGGRGGYCFEHNILLQHALTQLGFRVTGLAARVRWNVPADAVTPRGHMLLLVDLDDGPRIVDAGFGGMTLTGPLRLDTDAAQPTPHGPFRIRPEGRDHVMEAEVRGEWKALYRFDLQPQYQVDYEVSSWYLSTRPDSHFVTGLIAARPAGDGRRYGLRNTEFTIHHPDGSTERRRLTTLAELRRTLEGPFRLTLPDAPEVDQALDRLVAGARGAA